MVKGRLGLDRTADYLEELRAHSRSRAASVALLSPPPDTDPDDLDHLERVSRWGDPRDPARAIDPWSGQAKN